MNEPANDNHLAPWTLIEGEALAALATIPSNTVDLVCVDSPYSSGGLHLSARQQTTNTKYQMGTSAADHPNFGGDQRDQRSYAHWCCLWLSECFRVAKPGAPLLSFTDWRQVGAMIDSVQAGGWTYRGLPVWDKTTMCRPRMGGFRAQSEFVVWATKGGMNQEIAKSVGVLPGVFRFPISKAEKRFHTTQKPIALMKALVAVCAPGGLVLDCFAGSGSTGVAALKTGRRFLGVEQSPEYAAMARQRLSEVEARTQSSPCSEQPEAAAAPPLSV